MDERTTAAALLSEARANLPAVIDFRRRLHRRPEVGLQLPETQAATIEVLNDLGLAPELGYSLSSVVSKIVGELPGPDVVLRADMDALPLQEETGLPFSSEVQGIMHGCGHDTHVAMLLGATRLLVQRRHEIAGRVILMFQPGEEGYYGARLMLEEGLLDGVDRTSARAFALHISTRFPSGTVDLRGGQILAAPDMFEIHVRGRGGHASSPHATVDPIPVAAEIVTALQAMVTRRFNVFDPVVVTVSHIAAGTTDNVTPETAFLEGTIRTLSEATRDSVHVLIRRVADGICAAHGAEADVTIERGYPATVNDLAMTEVVCQTASELIGEDAVLSMASPLMGGEDFSYVLEQVPGAIAFLGARPVGEEPSTAPVNHSNRVVFDEAPMATGVALYAAVALRLLAPSGS